MLNSSTKQPYFNKQFSPFKSFNKQKTNTLNKQLPAIRPLNPQPRICKHTNNQFQTAYSLFNANQINESTNFLLHNNTNIKLVPTTEEIKEKCIGNNFKTLCTLDCNSFYSLVIKNGNIYTLRGCSLILTWVEIYGIIFNYTTELVNNIEKYFIKIGDNNSNATVNIVYWNTSKVIDLNIGAIYRFIGTITEEHGKVIIKCCWFYPVTDISELQFANSLVANAYKRVREQEIN